MSIMSKIDRENVADILALTPMQKGLLFHYIYEPDSNQFVEQLILRVSGNIDLEIFKKSWDFITENNEMLRSIFRWETLAEPVQIVLKAHPIPVNVIDLSIHDHDKKNKTLEWIIIADRSRKININSEPIRITLCKLEQTTYEIIICNHHILYDGWSNMVILKEFFWNIQFFISESVSKLP